MIDYYKVYQSIDDNILKNAVEVIKPNGNLSQIYSNLFLVFFIIAIFSLIISVSLSDSDEYYLFFLILSIVLFVLTLAFYSLGYSQKEKERKDSRNYSKNIKINNSIKTQKELFSNVMGNKDPKEFLEQGKKLEKFCSFYYSPTDNNFCKDNKINRYTFNLVFSKIYGNNEDKTTDLEKALKYIKEEN